MSSREREAHSIQLSTLIRQKWNFLYFFFIYYNSRVNINSVLLHYILRSGSMCTFHLCSLFLFGVAAVWLSACTLRCFLVFLMLVDGRTLRLVRRRSEGIEEIKFQLFFPSLFLCGLTLKAESCKQTLACIHRHESPRCLSNIYFRLHLATGKPAPVYINIFVSCSAKLSLAMAR